MKTLIRYALTFGLLPAAWLVAGCATCGSCQAQSATPQSHEAPPPPRVRDSFATPPTDAVPPAPPPPPPPETPTAPAPPPAPAGKVKVTKTREVEGAAVVIEQTAPGTIYVGNTGVMPVPAQAAAQPALAMGYPLIPGPVPDAVVFSVSKRILGGLYYAVTGKCPAPKAATASGFATPASFVMAPVGPPVQQFAAVPVVMQAPAPAAAPVVYMMPAPAAAPAAAPAPSPVVYQAPAALATPQAVGLAPRKWTPFRGAR